MANDVNATLADELDAPANQPTSEKNELERPNR